MKFLLLFFMFNTTNYNVKLKSAKRRLIRITKELRKIRTEKKSVVRELNLIEEKEAVLNHIVYELVKEKHRKDILIDSLKLSLVGLEGRLIILKEKLRKTLWIMEVIKLRLKQRLFFSFKPWIEVYKDIVFYSFLTRFERAEIENLYSVHKEYRMKIEELSSALNSVKSILQEKSYMVDSLKHVKKERKTFYSNIVKKEREKQKIQKELKNTIKKLENLIASFERKRKKAVKKGTRKDKTVYIRGKGALPRPCNGKIISRFGSKIHPKYKTKTKNNGIDISCNGNVIAVSGGKVIYADKFLSYGRTVIIDHNQGFYSIYAHLYSLNVKKGDRVKKRQKIGEVMGYLHFEFRKKGKAVNPLLWIK